MLLTHTIIRRLLNEVKKRMIDIQHHKIKSREFGLEGYRRRVKHFIEVFGYQIHLGNTLIAVFTK